MIWLAQQIAALLVIIFGGWVLLKLAARGWRRLALAFDPRPALRATGYYKWVIFAGMLICAAVIYGYQH